MLRTRSSSFAWGGVLIAIAGVGCSNQTGVAPTPDTRTADEAAIRAKDGTFEQGIAAKNLDSILALYEDGAVLFAPKAPAAVGKPAIRDGFQGLLMAPGVKMTFKSTNVEVSRSGDLAMQRATFQVETAYKDANPSTDTMPRVDLWTT